MMQGLMKNQHALQHSQKQKLFFPIIISMSCMKMFPPKKEDRKKKITKYSAVTNFDSYKVHFFHRAKTISIITSRIQRSLRFHFCEQSSMLHLLADSVLK